MVRIYHAQFKIEVWSVPDIKQSSGHATKDNFFSEWGVDKTETMSKTTVSAPVTPPATMTKKLPTSSSLWGSFTGSFFENPIAQEGKFIAGTIRFMTTQNLYK